MPDLPDEDRFVFPKTWKRRVRPRRGDGVDRGIELKPREARRHIKAMLPWLRETLALPENETFARDGDDFLDGNPNPVGAGAVGALLRIKHRWTHVSPRSMIHLLVKVHGLPLAACAAAEMMGLEAGDHGDRRIVYPLEDWEIGHEWAEAVGEFTDDLRALLAAAPEAEYVETVAALAHHRDSWPKAITASLIVPDVTRWVDQLCDLIGRHRPDPHWSTLLLRTVTDPRQLRIAGEAAATGSISNEVEVADLVARLGMDALPLLKRQHDRWTDASGRKALYQALAGMPDDDAMALLIDDLDVPAAVRPAMEAAGRYPVRALRTVAARVDGADRERRNLLATVLRADPVVLDVALPTMDEATRAAIEPLVRESRRVPAATDAELPRLLVEPPWADPRPRPKTGTVDGLVPPPIERLVWAEGERERLLPTDCFAYRTMDEWRDEAKRFSESGPPWPLYFLANAPYELAAPLAARWDGTDSYPSSRELLCVLARFGTDVAAHAPVLAEGEPDVRPGLLPLANLGAARIAADSLTRRKRSRSDAMAWLDRHPADAAALLIPDALGKARKRRRNAETALDYLRSTHGPSILLDAAAQYGEAAVAAIRPLAERDPLEPFGSKAPAPGAWAIPSALPEVLLEGREKSLPDAAVRRLIEALSVTVLGWRYPGIDVVAEHCDRESLSRFSWALFELWTTTGAPIEDNWALTQLACFGDDDTVRALVPLISTWPSDNLHKRAVLGLEVLGAIGTETALRAIHRIAEKVTHESVGTAAHVQINAIAAKRGLTTDQLADRLVPDFGIGDEATLLYDYGPRRFKVGFDEELRPRVTDEDGKPRKTLPKPGVRDDPELAESARKRFTQLKKDVRTVAADLVKRLEEDMVGQRARTKAEFDRYFVDHALVRHLAQRLIWTADHAGATTAFRLAEDGTFADVDENEFEPAADAAIRLAHPVLLGGQVEAWTAILADYELLQPFEQLARPVAALTDEELATGRLTRFEGAEVSVGALMGLTTRGWWRDTADFHGLETGMGVYIGEAAYLAVDLEPGLTSGNVHASPRQTLRDARVSADGGPEIDPGPPQAADLDPIAVAEALAPLVRAAGR